MMKITKSELTIVKLKVHLYTLVNDLWNLYFVCFLKTYLMTDSKHCLFCFIWNDHSVIITWAVTLAEHSQVCGIDLNISFFHTYFSKHIFVCQMHHFFFRIKGFCWKIPFYLVNSNRFLEMTGTLIYLSYVINYI